jgi:DNA uptake protein ComE-like DNA-binding protein
MFRDFFYIRKSDRQAILFVLCIMAVALAVILFTDSRMDSTPQYAADTVLNDNDNVNGQRTASYFAQPSTFHAQRFPFDPNTADSTQLLKLGLRPWQVRNIYKYRQKGGVYRKKEDFARLYGLTVKEYRELEPYIRISPDYTTPASSLVGEEEEYHERDTLKYPVKVEVPSSVNLNTTDTMLLRKVPGIGEAYARRILSYGQRLGGYVSPEQLREIEDFPEEAIPYFVVQHPKTQKINLNKLTLNQLQRHPYISFYQAKAITEYRRLHGPLHSLQDLKLHKDFPPEAIQRLEPYVEF